MSFELPAFYGTNFTPTIHSQIPASIDPSSNPHSAPRTVVVVGAGKGLGYHIALAYARAGSTALSISSRTSSDLDAVERALLNVNPKLEILKSICDVQDDASVDKLAQEVKSKWGSVDVVVANAGVMSKYISREGGGGSNLPASILEDADYFRVLNINFLGTWRIAKAFLPLLIASKDGPQTFICSSSIAAHSVESSFCPVTYNVSKMVCNRLIEHIANDHGKDGIQAYAIHPGGVLTAQTEGHRGGAWEREEGEKGILGDDEGLAGAFCVWLTKEKRPWLSGRYVSVNWDVGELEAKKDEIVERDLLKFRMTL